MDIEWAVKGRKVYILQARPITTLTRHYTNNYDINGTRSGSKLLNKTNVGEIFMKPVSPMTFSVLEKINEFVGLPDWLDNVCGQAYMNVSVMCSLMVSFGRSREKAYETVKDLVGGIPEGCGIPISPFDKKAFRKNLLHLFFPKEKSKLTKKQKHEMVANLHIISEELIGRIKTIGSSTELMAFWDDVLQPKLNDGLASILAESGMSLVPLFNLRKKITEIAGEDMANRLCTGSLGQARCRVKITSANAATGPLTRWNSWLRAPMKILHSLIHCSRTAPLLQLIFARCRNTRRLPTKRLSRSSSRSILPNASGSIRRSANSSMRMFFART